MATANTKWDSGCFQERPAFMSIKDGKQEKYQLPISYCPLYISRKYLSVFPFPFAGGKLACGLGVNLQYPDIPRVLILKN